MKKNRKKLQQQFLSVFGGRGKKVTIGTFDLVSDGEIRVSGVKSPKQVVLDPENFRLPRLKAGKDCIPYIGFVSVKGKIPNLEKGEEIFFMTRGQKTIWTSARLIEAAQERLDSGHLMRIVDTSGDEIKILWKGSCRMALDQVEEVAKLLASPQRNKTLFHQAWSSKRGEWVSNGSGGFSFFKSCPPVQLVAFKKKRKRSGRNQQSQTSENQPVFPRSRHFVFVGHTDHDRPGVRASKLARKHCVPSFVPVACIVKQETPDSQTSTSAKPSAKKTARKKVRRQPKRNGEKPAPQRKVKGKKVTKPQPKKTKKSDPTQAFLKSL